MKILWSILAALGALGVASSAFSAGRPMVYDPPLQIMIKHEYKCRKRIPPDPNEPAANSTPKLLYRCKFVYPYFCEPEANWRESVDLLYDVGEKGIPENIRITRSTNECFNREAGVALARWRFEELGTTTTNLTTTIYFEQEW